ncbi:MAG: hypothetical protein HY264_01460 [Chloroflexi bacterium]|nr:hypothetical protein [Chloroflexota bacterium]
MTSQRELDRVLGVFFIDGADEVADRVIEAALDEIDHTPQRHAARLPRRLQRMNITSRFAAAAVIGVIAIGGALYLFRSGPSGIGNASPTPGATATQAHPTPTTPPLTPTPKPDPMPLTGPLPGAST